MVEVTSMVLGLAILTYAAMVGRSTTLLIRRLRRERGTGRRRTVRGEMSGLVATVFTMVTLGLVTVVTILFIAFHLTPVEVMRRLGWSLPQHSNIALLLIFLGTQALLKLYSVDKLVDTVHDLHYPESLPTTPDSSSSPLPRIDVSVPPPPVSPSREEPSSQSGRTIVRGNVVLPAHPTSTPKVPTPERPPVPSPPPNRVSWR